MKDVPAFTDLDVNFLKPFSTFFKKELNYTFLIEKGKQQTVKQQK